MNDNFFMKPDYSRRRCAFVGFLYSTIAQRLDIQGGTSTILITRSIHISSIATVVDYLKALSLVVSGYLALGKHSVTSTHGSQVRLPAQTCSCSFAFGTERLLYLTLHPITSPM